MRSSVSGKLPLSSALLRTLKKKSPGAGIAEARTHYTERTTTQTKYSGARKECLERMAVLRQFLVNLAFNNKDLAGPPHPPWLIAEPPLAPL
jgi:hypothetical protein